MLRSVQLGRCNLASGLRHPHPDAGSSPRKAPQSPELGIDTYWDPNRDREDTFRPSPLTARRVASHRWVAFFLRLAL
jgi:hypothetical protein